MKRVLGYRVKSDEQYVHILATRRSYQSRAAYHKKSRLMTKANALRLLADWLDLGYLGRVVRVVASS